MKKNKDLISIAVPVYNEYKGLEELIHKTVRLRLNKEIIIIDDGSNIQKTIAILQKIKRLYPKVRILKNRVNIGKARSIKKALQISKGNIFVILDGDSELNPHDIITLYKQLKNSGADMVNGVRSLGSNYHTQTYTGLLTKTARFLFTSFTKVFYGIHIHDVLSGFKMFYTKNFKEYSFSTKRFGLETELIVHTIKSMGKIAETTVHYYPRTYKEGKKINLLDGFEILFYLIRETQFYPLIKSLCIAFLLSLTSFALYTGTMQIFNTTDSLPNNFTALNIIYNHRFDLTNIRQALIQRDLIGITGASNSAGLIFAKTPIVLGLLSAPFFYFINSFFRVNHFSLDLFFTNYNQYVGKLTAALYVSMSVFLLYFVIRKITKKDSIALISSATYALCTNVFNTASQANWQHGVSLFFITLLLFVVFNYKRSVFMLIAGTIIGLLIQIRISNGFYFIFVPIYVWLSQDTKRKKILSILTLILGLFLGYGSIYTLNTFLHVPFGYSDEIIYSFKVFQPVLFIQNLISLLFSFNYGLFFFSPVLLFAFVYLFTKKNARFMTIIALSLALPLILFPLFASFWWAWAGGQSLNARLITEALPIIIIYLSISLKYILKRRVFTFIFIIFFIISFFINILTVYFMDYSWYSNVKGGFWNQNYNAWFSKPILIGALIKNDTLAISHLYRKGNAIILGTKVYRPSLFYRRIVKLFDGEQKILEIK